MNAAGISLVRDDQPTEPQRPRGGQPRALPLTLPEGAHAKSAGFRRISPIGISLRIGFRRSRSAARLRWPAPAVWALLLAACGGAAPDARYPEREPGCAVKSFAASPEYPVDELGTVTVECTSGVSCERRLLDAVCARGGDTAWGLGENALTATRRVAHAAHERRAASGPRERGCKVQVFDEAPPMRTENIGPVVASCAEDDSREVCLRELEDQVCLLGGDVLWQVEGPSPRGGEQHVSGRAAHTK